MKPEKIFCLILILMLITVGCKKKETQTSQQTDVETDTKTETKPAPAFTLQDINGKNVSLSDFKGKVVILDFWATWCAPCVQEIPHFIELYNQYKDKGFAMVGISLDQADISVVKSFVQKLKVNYPIMMGDGKVDKAYGEILSIPTTFVIDPAGNIRQKYIGYHDKAVFENDIKILLPKTEQ